MLQRDRVLWLQEKVKNVVSRIISVNGGFASECIDVMLVVVTNCFASECIDVTLIDIFTVD